MGLYDTTLGVLLIGIIFNTYLFGIVSYQFARYFTIPFKDPLWMRLWVAFLALIDTVHSVSEVYMAWYYCITNFDNPVALAVALWPYPLTSMLTAFMAFMAHAFLGLRLYKLNKNRYMYGAVLLISFTAFALGASCSIQAWTILVLTELGVLNNRVTAWLVLTVSVDIFLAAMLAYTLAKSKAGFRRTDHVVNRLIRGSIQTGLIAAVFSICTLVTFLRASDTNLYGMFVIPVGRIYTNTLMDTLLARHDLKGVLYGGPTFIEMDHRSQIVWANGTSAGTGTTYGNDPANVGTRGTQVSKVNGAGASGFHSLFPDSRSDNVGAFGSKDAISSSKDSREKTEVLGAVALNVEVELGDPNGRKDTMDV